MLLSASLFAQRSTQVDTAFYKDLDKILYDSGDNLQSYSTLMGTGYFLIALGTAGSVLAIKDDKKEIAYIGMGVGAVGIILQMVSVGKIARAGKILKEGRLRIPIN